MAFLDLLSQYFAELIVSIVAVVIAELALHYYFEGKRPDFEITHLNKKYPAYKENPDEGWALGWQIFNRGKVTATGVDVNVDIHETSGYPLGMPAKRFKMFSQVDILPEKTRNEPPPTVVISYFPSDQKFALYQPMFHTTMDSLELKHGVSFEVFPAEAGTPSEPHIPLGYMVELTLSGSNLEDGDRRTHRYLVSAGTASTTDPFIPHIQDLDPYLG